MAKSIFVLQKKAARPLTPFVYPLQSLQEPEAIQKFMVNFKNWKQENAI
jgi:site-specific DNA-methyltransferase (adenine-specific)